MCTLPIGLKLEQVNDIPVLVLTHAVGQAKIALQGAQLLSWKPAAEQQDLLWLSPIEPFKLGQAIRGGIPLCYPWFGTAKSPSHGTARLALWQLTEHDIQPHQVRLVFSKFSSSQQCEARVTMLFDKQCEIQFTHYGQEEAQFAFHSYFNVGDIRQVEVKNLPTTCFDSIHKQPENVPSPRKITQRTDCIYSAAQGATELVDHQYQRQIQIVHHNATEIVLWNPWDLATSAMGEQDYQNMLCIETARIYHSLQFGETVSLQIIS